MQKKILQVLAVLALTTAILSFFWPTLIWVFVLIVPAGIIAVLDINQTEHALRRNFPLIGRARWLAEFIRPFVRQYFIESDIDGAPLNRMSRSIVYQRAKGDIDTIPYGTKLDVYQDGYEWLGHSLQAINASEIDQDPRIVVGGPDCKQPYSASVLNISAMSYGAISSAAIRALNLGAASGGFAHNTGEGGLSPY